MKISKYPYSVHFEILKLKVFEWADSAEFELIRFQATSVWYENIFETIKRTEGMEGKSFEGPARNIRVKVEVTRA